MTKHNGHKAKIAIAATLAAGVIAVVGAGSASATHTHSLQTGNGSCVLLARNGGEKNVTLPHATGPGDRRHPLHVNVHLGEPGAGDHIEIGVAGTASDPCYVAPAPVDP
jgi:hypothetical protein